MILYSIFIYIYNMEDNTLINIICGDGSKQTRKLFDANIQVV